MGKCWRSTKLGCPAISPRGLNNPVHSSLHSTIGSVNSSSPPCPNAEGESPERPAPPRNSASLDRRSNRESEACRSTNTGFDRADEPNRGSEAGTGKFKSPRQVRPVADVPTIGEYSPLDRERVSGSTLRWWLHVESPLCHASWSTGPMRHSSRPGSPLRLEAGAQPTGDL